MIRPSYYDVIQQVDSLSLQIEILQGRNLVAKDFNALMGKNTSSDPYVRIFVGGQQVHKTGVVKRTLNPTWNDKNNNSYHTNLVGQAARDLLQHSNPISLVIYDKDTVGDDDCMGVVNHPLTLALNGSSYNDDEQQGGVARWYQVQNGERKTGHYCKDASGEILINVNYQTKAKMAILEDLLESKANLLFDDGELEFRRRQTRRRSAAGKPTAGIECLKTPEQPVERSSTSLLAPMELNSTPSQRTLNQKVKTKADEMAVKLKNQRQESQRSLGISKDGSPSKPNTSNICSPRTPGAGRVPRKSRSVQSSKAQLGIGIPRRSASLVSDPSRAVTPTGRRPNAQQESTRHLLSRRKGREADNIIIINNNDEDESNNINIEHEPKTPNVSPRPGMRRSPKSSHKSLTDSSSKRTPRPGMRRSLSAASRRQSMKQNNEAINISSTLCDVYKVKNKSIEDPSLSTSEHQGTSSGRSSSVTKSRRNRDSISASEHIQLSNSGHHRPSYRRSSSATKIQDSTKGDLTATNHEYKSQATMVRPSFRRSSSNRSNKENDDGRLRRTARCSSRSSSISSSIHDNDDIIERRMRVGCSPDEKGNTSGGGRRSRSSERRRSASSERRRRCGSTERRRSSSTERRRISSTERRPRSESCERRRSRSTLRRRKKGCDDDDDHDCNKHDRPRQIVDGNGGEKEPSLTKEESKKLDASFVAQPGIIDKQRTKELVKMLDGVEKAFEKLEEEEEEENRHIGPMAEKKPIKNMTSPEERQPTRNTASPKALLARKRDARSGGKKKDEMKIGRSGGTTNRQTQQQPSETVELSRSEQIQNAMEYLKALSQKKGNDEVTARSSHPNIEDEEYFRKLDNMLPKKADETTEERAEEMVKMFFWMKKKGKMGG